MITLFHYLNNETGEVASNINNEYDDFFYSVTEAERLPCGFGV